MRLLNLWILCFVLGLSFTACFGSEPEPTPDIPATVTAQVQAQLADRTTPTVQASPTPVPPPTLPPTVTPYPTSTPYPTATPYPTPLPTSTPTPTATATPTATPTPTPTPTPEPTATPTPTPTLIPTPRPTATRTPTPTPAPADWRASGHWQRDTIWEAQFRETLGADGNYKIATLFPDPTSLDNEVYLTLGCVNGLAVAYLNHYQAAVPSWVDFYVIGIWDTRTSEWLDQYYGYENPFITLDGAAIYIYNPLQVRQVLETLRFADRNRRSNWELSAGMFSLEDDNKPGFWGVYNVDGIDEVLEFLTCYDGIQ